MLFGLLAALLISAQAAEVRSVSLEQAYEASLKWSEVLAQQGETVAQLQARIDELWSYVKPQVNLTATEIFQHVPSGASGVSTSYTQRTREQAQFTVHQTIFTGLRDYLSVRQAKAQAASADLALARARQLLYRDVAQAYLNLLSVRHQLNIQKNILRTTDDRIKELRQRQRLGRSRTSEVLAAESQRAQVAAQLETALQSEAAAQLELRFLTGIDGGIDPIEVAAPRLPPIDRHLQAALSRPDVEEARQSARAAAYGVPIAARQRWPMIDMDGNYYLHRPPPQDAIRWDVTFSLSLPFYEGGKIRAQVREAQAARRSADEALSQALRQADLDVRTAHSALSTSLSIVAALVDAARLAAENAKAQAQDYRAGLVTNLDVLGAINSLEQVELTLDQARIQAAFAGAQLAVASGMMGAQP